MATPGPKSMAHSAVGQWVFIDGMGHRSMGVRSYVMGHHMGGFICSWVTLVRKLEKAVAVRNSLLEGFSC